MWGGGDKYGLRAKNHQQNNERADKKRRKRKKGQEKRKENDRARTMFHKIMGNLEENAGNGGHNIIFFSLLF
jgi:hypothetical protein